MGLLPRLPFMLVAFAIGGTIAYFAFFRHTPVAETAEVSVINEKAAPVAASPGGKPLIAAAVMPSPAPVQAEPSPAPAPTPAPTAPSPVNEVRKLYDEGKWREARRALAPIFVDCDDRTRAELAEKALAINHKLLVTNVDERDVDLFEVQSGDSLITFCRRQKTLHGEYGIVKMLNSIRNDSTLKIGQKLRVPRGTWSIFVDKSLYTLWIMYEGTPFKAYKVCVGANDKTPAAKWTVGDKNPKPAWYAPPEWLEQEKLHNPIPYGHPKNPLGEYWVPMMHDQNLHQGFGIHGTNQPATIGTKASNGCVRMLNEDVVEVARVCWKGMDVVTAE